MGFKEWDDESVPFVSLIPAIHSVFSPSLHVDRLHLSFIYCHLVVDKNDDIVRNQENADAIVET